MKKVNGLHKKAMKIAEMALIEKVKGNSEKVIELFKEAYVYERDAALLTTPTIDSEPSRSILFRSAATLALNAGDIREAEKMVAMGLAGEPPVEIANELRDLYEQINFHRHLDVRGIILESNEIQLSLAGPGIGFGIARSEELIKRVDIIEKLTYRTIERKCGKPFRSGGKPEKRIKEEFEPYLSVPRAASFSVTIRIGRSKPERKLFPDFDDVAEIIDEIATDIDLINANNEKRLKEKIKNEAYFRNFLGLTRELSPDGKNVQMVGLTTSWAGKEKKVAITRSRENIRLQDIKPDVKVREEKKISISGTLSFADAHQKKIKITDEKGKKFKISVPEGLSDIVKPYWEEMVTVFGKKSGDIIVLEDIKKADT